MGYFLRARKYQYILYRITTVKSAEAIADILRYFAYKLEANVRPTNSQRTRLVTELLALPGRHAFSEYGVRLWYYISTSQLADHRLAKSLLMHAKNEANLHLQVWGFLAASLSANGKHFFVDFRQGQDSELKKIRNEALAYGRERCSVFYTMLELLATGRANVGSSIAKVSDLSSNDIELMLLAYGRNQLFFYDDIHEATFQRFIVDEGIRHESPLVSEYSIWCSRVRKLRSITADWTLLENHPHSNISRVRSAAFRLLGSLDNRSRDCNFEYLVECEKKENDAVRFEIFSALSSRLGSYDSIMRTRNRKYLDAFIQWHMEETDDRCADRQFSFLVYNLDDVDVREYVIEEIRASDHGKLKNYLPIIRLNQNLPADFVNEMQRIGVLSSGTQFELPLIASQDEKRKNLMTNQYDIQSVGLHDKILPISNLEDEVERSYRMPMLETVVIATANPREIRAVLSELKLQSEGLGFQVTTEPDDILPYHEGRLPGKTGARRVIVVRADDTGPLNANDLLRRILNNFDARFIFFIGCAALLDEKQKFEPNTVFVARRAIDVDKREIGENGASYDMDQAPGDYRVFRNIDALVDAGHFDSLKVITNRYFLSGSAFANSRDSANRKDYVSKFPKDAVVLEMEAYAVLKAVELRRLEGLDVTVSVIKGISDLGDESAQESKELAQYTATMNAMLVACKLLKFL